MHPVRRLLPGVRERSASRERLRCLPSLRILKMRLGLTVGRLTCDHEWVDYAHPTERCRKCGTTREVPCHNQECDCHLSWTEWMDKQRKQLVAAGFTPREGESTKDWLTRTS